MHTLKYPQCLPLPPNKQRGTLREKHFAGPKQKANNCIRNFKMELVMKTAWGYAEFAHIPRVWTPLTLCRGLFTTSLRTKDRGSRGKDLIL